MTTQSPPHPRPRRLAALAAGVAAALTLGASLPVAAAPLSPSTTASPAHTSIPAAGRVPADLSELPEWPTFTDIDSNPFKEEIEWMSWNRISTGWETGPETAEYRPHAPILRDAMAAFLERMSRTYVYGMRPHSFVDISGTIFEREMSWMYDFGISTGWFENGVRTYRPFQPVLRAEMAAFIYRLAGSPPHTPPRTSPFTDVSTRHAFYKEITWLESTGITTGWIEPDGTRIFHPQRPILRDAMAAFLYRFATHPTVAVNVTSAEVRARTAGGTTYQTNTSIVCPPGQYRNNSVAGGTFFFVPECAPKLQMRTDRPRAAWALLWGGQPPAQQLYKPEEGWTYERVKSFGAKHNNHDVYVAWY